MLEKTDDQMDINDIQMIFIIGFMGSGKTTIGRLLANRLGWNFIDLDTLIQIREGRSIPDIFESHSEAFFRKAEYNALRQLGGLKNIVVSTGGGTPCYFDNIHFMKSMGKVIWLDNDFGTLYKRIIGTQSGTRPLVSGNSKEKLKELFVTRGEYYKLADVKISCEPDDLPEAILAKIVKFFLWHTPIYTVTKIIIQVFLSELL